MTRERVAELPSLRPVVADILSELGLAVGAQTLRYLEDATSLTELAEERNDLAAELLEELREQLADIKEIIAHPGLKGPAHKLAAEILATF